MQATKMWLARFFLLSYSSFILQPRSESCAWQWGGEVIVLVVILIQEIHLQVNTTSPHAATASLDYKYNKKNYRLGATFSASYMGEKKFDVQDRLSVNGESHDAYFRCQLPQYVLCNLSVIQTFYNKVKVTVGVDNIFNYVPKTLGSGITMFNVPATAGAKAHVQVEVLVDELVKAFRKKK